MPRYVMICYDRYSDIMLRLLRFAQEWFSPTLSDVRKIQYLVGTAEKPESRWGALQAWDAESPWLVVKDFVQRTGLDLRRIHVSVGRIMKCMDVVTALSPEGRDLVMEQLHPTIRGLAQTALRVQVSECPSSLSRHLMYELIALKMRGTSGLQELLQARLQHAS